MLNKILSIIAIIFMFVGCSPKSEVELDTRVTVFVSIPPLVSLVEKVGGDLVNVSALIKPGDNPHSFEPTPNQIARLNMAELFMTIGMPFEKVIGDKISDGKSLARIANLDTDVPKLILNEHHQHDHDHSNHVFDPHIWLAPSLLVKIAENIAFSLATVDAGNAEIYLGNLKKLQFEILQTDLRLRSELEPFKGESIYLFHPSFGYFCADYGLRQVAVEADGKSPSPRQIRKLIDNARSDSVKTIFADPQFDQSAAKTIAEAIDGKVVTLDPLAMDILSNLLDISAKISAALAPEVKHVE